jgi:cytoskeletal protein CcmA (bactofilin family)
VELGLLFVAQDTNWRKTRTNGVWLSNKSLGGGSFTLEGVDPKDGDLADSEYDSTLLTGTGVNGQARHKTQLTLVPVIKPLEALRTCLHASGQINIMYGKRITVIGGAISTNGVLYNDGTIDGDAQAASILGNGNITGVPTVPAQAKQMPNTQVISDYISKATPLSVSGTIERAVLTPTRNPWGPENPDGIYYINTTNNLTIRNCRIQGTLIVRLVSGKKLVLDNAVFLHSYRSYYPVLIVEGDTEIKIRSCEYSLSEAANYTNYNPSSAPYQGQSDYDWEDEYPNEIQGLVYVKGSLKLLKTACIRGTVICDGSVSCEEQNTIMHNPALYTSPPEGFTFVDGVVISPDSWKQTVD